MNLFTNQKQIPRLGGQTYDCQRGRMQRRDGQGVWNGHVHTTVFKMDNQQGPTVEHRELCSVLCGSLDGRAVWGRMDTCICPTESLHCSPETVTTLLISYTQYKIKNEKKQLELLSVPHQMLGQKLVISKPILFFPPQFLS